MASIAIIMKIIKPRTLSVMIGSLFSVHCTRIAGSSQLIAWSRFSQFCDSILET
jgi:hypothetical protein